jgi:hypothetical protein
VFIANRIKVAQFCSQANEKDIADRNCSYVAARDAVFYAACFGFALNTLNEISNTVTHTTYLLLSLLYIYISLDNMFRPVTKVIIKSFPAKNR